MKYRHAIIWKTLENNMLSERRQSQQTMYYMIMFICNVQSTQVYRVEQNKAEIDVFLELSCFFNDPAEAEDIKKR